MFLIDIENKQAVSLEKQTFSGLDISERYDLQEWIVDNPAILGENLLIIQKEFDGFADTSERLDLLALDEKGRLVVIENKLDDSGKDVVWQALKYVSYCATLTKSEICEIYQQYLGDSGIAAENISEFYNGNEYDIIRINPVEGEQRIILVAANFRKEVTSTVLWLRNYHGVDITCIKVTPYKDGAKLYLDAEQILPMQDIGDYQIRLTAKKQEETVASNEEAVRHQIRYRFWEKALPVMREKTGVFMNVSPSKENWCAAGSGHTGVIYNAVIRKDGARAELYIDTGDKEYNKWLFHELTENMHDIEKMFGPSLDWREMPEKNVSCISVHYYNYGLDDEDHWDVIAEFLADSLSQLIKVLGPLIDEAISG